MKESIISLVEKLRKIYGYQHSENCASGCEGPKCDCGSQEYYELLDKIIACCRPPPDAQNTNGNDEKTKI